MNGHIDIIRRMAAAIIIVIALSSCASHKDVSENVRYVYVNKVDSIEKRDSIYIHDIDTFMVKGDTIFSIRWRIRETERVKTETCTDTILRTDTLYMQTVTEKNLSGYQQFCVTNFPAAVIIIIIMGIAIYLIKKRT